MTELFNDYAYWESHRADLWEHEDTGGPPARDWQASDDEAVDLLARAMLALTACRDALSETGEAISDHWQAYRCGFTCSEAEALYEAYRHVGLDMLAEHFMCEHAESDDEESDLHETVGEEGWRRKDDPT
jgi:hypothetical protein